MNNIARRRLWIFSFSSPFPCRSLSSKNDILECVTHVINWSNAMKEVGFFSHTWFFSLATFTTESPSDNFSHTVDLHTILGRLVLSYFSIIYYFPLYIFNSSWFLTFIFPFTYTCYGKNTFSHILVF